ncbi:conserved hypothetical protein [Paenibacillus curdlanolyticus YK9]|uniref:Uncharacterized protein n=1 Tax=Paenibacillus curdlanolyticus YK9 TaxID=717606 RepID=E0I9C9_9BACL|nr:hypothetical protein [Paenibacillus curdlanolyticus]EFM11013.1 conserved hypothetical protein [Paenibacillus curdlanolyticus YK9]
MSKKTSASWDMVQLAGAVADLKRDHYRILLTMSVLVDLLVDRGFVSREELERKTAAIDDELETLIDASLRPMG